MGPAARSPVHSPGASLTDDQEPSTGSWAGPSPSLACFPLPARRGDGRSLELGPGLASEELQGVAADESLAEG